MTAYYEGWTADDWVKHLTLGHDGWELVSATITRGPRRDLVVVKHLHDGKPASITVRLKHRKAVTL